MDINDLRGIATVFAFIGFMSVCAWAYSSKRKTAFDEASQYPFSDQDQPSAVASGRDKAGESN